MCEGRQKLVLTSVCFKQFSFGMSLHRDIVEHENHTQECPFAVFDRSGAILNRALTAVTVDQDRVVSESDDAVLGESLLQRGCPLADECAR